MNPDLVVQYLIRGLLLLGGALVFGALATLVWGGSVGERGWRQGSR